MKSESVDNMKKNKPCRNVKIWALLALALLLVIKVPKHSIVRAEQEDPYVSENITEGIPEENSGSDALDTELEDTAEGEEDAKNIDADSSAGEDDKEQEESGTPLDVEKYITDVTIAYKTDSSEWMTIEDGTKDIPADAQLKFSMTYAGLPVDSVESSGNTISYTLPDLLEKPSVQSANIQTSDGTTIGTIGASEDSKSILLTFTAEFLKREEGEETKTISGSFAFYAYPDQNKVKENPLQQITVGTKKITLSFEQDSDARLGQLNLTKSDATFGTDDGGGISGIYPDRFCREYGDAGRHSNGSVYHECKVYRKLYRSNGNRDNVCIKDCRGYNGDCSECTL